MSLGWIHPDNEVWHYGTLRLDGQIKNGDFGSIVYIKEKRHYSCTSTKTSKPQYAKYLSMAKQIVERMLK